MKITSPEDLEEFERMEQRIQELEAEIQSLYDKIRNDRERWNKGIEHNLTLQKENQRLREALEKIKKHVMSDDVISISLIVKIIKNSTKSIDGLNRG